MAEKSIKKNFIFNIAYQVLILLMPLITTPYLSRVLGTDGVGIYSYANSMVSYFLLVAVLGSGVFGQRAIGYVQQNIEERSRSFWEIFILRMCTCFTTLVVYALFVVFAANEAELIIYLILTLNILNVVIDITWFFQGMEEFGKTVTTSTFFRVLYVVLIFVLVKTSADLWIYVLLTVLNSVFGNIVLWFLLPKYLCKVTGINPFRNIKSVIQLFIPTIATQIYVVLDKSMIGWFSEGYTENGYYEQAEKIVKITLTAVTALGTVMIPRISRCFKDGDEDKVKYYIYKSYSFIWLLAIPVAIGLITVASFFVPVFLGPGYEKCVLLVLILSPLPINIGLSNVTGLQYFVPTGKQNWLTATVVVGAIVNLVLNLCLIPFIASVGAAIASVIAEACVTFAGFLYLWKTHSFSLKKIFVSSWRYWIAGVIMGIAVMLVKYFVPVAVWSLIVLVVTGVVVYFFMLLILRDELFFEFLLKFFSLIKLRSNHTASELDDASENFDNKDNNNNDINGV